MIFQVADILVYKYFISNYYQDSSIFFITYISFILVGMYIGENIRLFINGQFIQGLIIFILSAIFGYLFVRLSFRIFNNEKIDSSLYNFCWYTYNFFATIMLFSISRTMLKMNLIRNVFENIGRISFGIYLIHPLILDIIGHFIKGMEPIIFDIYTVLSFVIVIIVSYYLTKTLKTFKFSQCIVGK
jgi:peptidoglycan/LPS O-acetylase OafA/YrhL